MASLIFSMTKSTLSAKNMSLPYKKLSKKEVKISSKPWITKEILAKMNYIETNFIPNYLKVNNQILIFIRYLYKKFRNKVV